MSFKKWTCMNSECGKRCSVEIPEGYAPNPDCLLSGSRLTFKPNWLIESFLPKLTAEVFDLPDCPEWAEYAAVDEDGEACWFEEKPVVRGNFCWGVTGERAAVPIHGRFDASEWKNSLIERHPKLDGCKAAETGTPLARKVIPIDERIAALEKELEVLRKKQRRRNITKMMIELSDQWSALKREAEQLDSEDEDPLGLYEN